MSKGQPVFNLPGVIVALLAAFAAVQVMRDVVSPEIDAWLITTFGFIPARFSRHFAPGGLANSIAQQIASGVPEGTTST